MNDEFILKFFETQKRPRWNWLKNIDIFTYLKHRFIDIDDKDTLLEILYRIKHNIEIKPKCIICGKPCKFVVNKGYSDFCNGKCHKTKEAKILIMNTRKKTCLEKYGCEYTFQSVNNKEKTKKTCLEKYGVDNPAKSHICKVKTKNTIISKYGSEQQFFNSTNRKRAETCKEKYGVNNVMQLDMFKQKQYISNIQTLHEKYGVDNVSKLGFVKAKSKATNLEKYGVEYVSQNKEIMDKAVKTSKQIMIQTKCTYNNSWSIDARKKRYDTFSKNKTYNVSKLEQQIYQKLKDLYGENDVFCQYKDELYPYNCDFFIKSKLLYIEINGTWTHGKHPYNVLSKVDNDLVSFWKSKNTKYYDNAIYTWTILDVKKQNIAKQNGINYLVIYSNKVDECIYQIINYK